MALPDNEKFDDICNQYIVGTIPVLDGQTELPHRYRALRVSTVLACDKERREKRCVHGCVRV